MSLIAAVASLPFAPGKKEGAVRRNLDAGHAAGHGFDFAVLEVEAEQFVLGAGVLALRRDGGACLDAADEEQVAVLRDAQIDVALSHGQGSDAIR